MPGLVLVEFTQQIKRASRSVRGWGIAVVTEACDTGDTAIPADCAPFSSRFAMLPLSRLIALLVAGAFFMENLDGTVIATALPQMARSFHAQAVDLNIGMTAYMLTLAVFIPISGWLADRLGARSVFATAIGIFTMSSILCAMSTGLWGFTGARIVQGIGGAMMVPVGRLVVLRNTDKRDLMSATATITWPGLAAPIVGPPVGGFITTYASWHWIFLLNVPLGLIALVLTFVLIANDRDDGRRPLDWLGFVLSGLSCTTLVYGLELLSRHSAPVIQAVIFITVGLGTGVVTVGHLWRHRTPLLNLHTLRIPTFAVSICGGSLFRMTISTVPFLLPLLFQIGFGLDAFTAGLLVLAVFAGNFCMKMVTTPMLRRFGFRPVLIINGLLSALTLLGCGFLTPDMSYVIIVGVLFASGLCRSMQFTAYNTLGFADVPKPEMSSASTLASMMMQLSTGMGIALGALALRAAAWLYDSGTDSPTMSDFRIAFGFVGLLGLVAVIDSFTLARDAGALVSGYRATR